MDGVNERNFYLKLQILELNRCLSVIDKELEDSKKRGGTTKLIRPCRLESFYLRREAYAEYL